MIKEKPNILMTYWVLLNVVMNLESNFGPSSYLSKQNKELPKDYIIQDGFEFLVIGYTIKNIDCGPEFRRRYVGMMPLFAKLNFALVD